MATIEVPLTDQEIDTDDGATSMAMTVGMLILGFALFAWAQSVGGYVAQEANGFVSNILGTDPTSGEDSGADLL